MDLEQEKKTNEHIAVMANDLRYIKESLREVKSKLDVIDSNFAKREEVNKMMEEDRQQQTKLWEEVDKLKTRQLLIWGGIALLGFLVGNNLLKITSI